MAENMHDWGILKIPGVEEVIKQAAVKVARQYDQSADDLEQEARVRVCDLRTDLPECAYGYGALHLGTLQYRLVKDLQTIATKEALHRDRNGSYEDRYDQKSDEDYAPRPASIAIRTEVSGYTRELVESLLPAVWDESFCYGIRVENAPDHDMPRGQTNKSTGNTLAAHIADIKAGWSQAPLSRDEKRALLLGYGLDWIQKDIGTQLGVSQATIGRWLYSGVGKVMAFLNGDDALMAELENVEATAA